MKESPATLRRQVQALEERVSRLSNAVLRISSSLDLDTVLQEVVDSARALADARYGVITTDDGAGNVQEFVTSGFTQAEKQQMADWTDGPRLLKHFRDLEAPLRLSGLRDYVSALGFSSNLMRSDTLMGTPMRHHDEHVGNFFLAEKEGGREFTEADEEVLVLLASQAATAIANARAHRDERRARADLETLIETSPVGIVVFDGATGAPVSFNREARRIVEGLSKPGHPVEELLDTMTCRRADGREISLAEFPIAQHMSTVETVRAEEITLSVPDGRCITTLVNATPIRSRDSTVESMVVTLQDLAPLEELEHMRAEFLGIVSHELRTPLISIKGSTATVLSASTVPDPAEMLQFFRVIDEQADHMRGLIGDLLDHGRIVTGTLSVSPEPMEVAALLDQARNTFLSGGGSRTLSVDLPEDLPRVMADGARIVQVLGNLLSNAARHSPESAPIRVAAVTRRRTRGGSRWPTGAVAVRAEQLPHLFRKHSSADGGEGARGGRSGPGHLQGAGGGARWPHLGRERRSGARHDVHLHRYRWPRRPPPAVAGPPPVAPRKAREKTRILVVDDDPQMLRYVRDALTRAGYEAIVTGDCEELADLVRTRAPALVLLDLLLPSTDGIVLMERVPELSDLPVIFISAYGRDETVVRAAGRGRRRLHRQAVLTVGADGARAGSPAPTVAARAVRARGADHPLRPAPGRRGRAAGGADGDRVRPAPRALDQRGPGADVRLAAAPGVGQAEAGGHRPQARTRRREAAPPQAGRRRGRTRPTSATSTGVGYRMPGPNETDG